MMCWWRIWTAGRSGAGPPIVGYARLLSVPVVLMITQRLNGIDDYVGYLRRKLGDDRAPRLIHTIRGVGYQLRAPKPPDGSRTAM
jgi:hypothetical protein